LNFLSTCGSLDFKSSKINVTKRQKPPEKIAHILVLLTAATPLIAYGC